MNAHMSSFADVSKVESTRYALIRRLGYVFRHDLVVNLQPLNLVCQVLHQRLNATSLDVSSLRDSVDRISRLVRLSIDSCSDVVSWFNPDSSSTIAVDVAVGECLGNVRSSFSFRGFTIRYEESGQGTIVSRVAVREVLSAALIAATDHAQGLNDIAVTVQSAENAVKIAIQMQMRRDAKESHPEHDAYRLIDWGDVQILADFHGTQVSRSGENLVEIRMQPVLCQPSAALG